jgi:putative ABC transport system permease protein
MRFGPGHRSDTERNRKDLTLEDALALKAQIPEIRAVSPERYLFDGTTPTVKYRDQESTAPTVAGVYPDYSLANNHYVEEGRFFTDADIEHGAAVAVIGDDVRKALFPRESPLNKTVELNGWKYVVVGVLEEKGDFGGGSSNHWFFIPFSAFDRQFPQIKNSRGDTIHIATVPYGPEQVDAVIEKGRALLRTRRGVPFNAEDDFYILTPDKMIESFQGITRGITGAMIFIASLSLLIGGVGVMNIMLVSVTERTREIGVRKAVGAFRRDIVLQFLTEATTLALLGGVIGVVVGVAVPMAIKAAFAQLPAETPFWVVLVGLLVSMSVGIFFGLYPAVKASRLDPIEALRYE